LISNPPFVVPTKNLQGLLNTLAHLFFLCFYQPYFAAQILKIFSFIKPLFVSPVAPAKTLPHSHTSPSPALPHTFVPQPDRKPEPGSDQAIFLDCRHNHSIKMCL
jgi:hypothetical protein